MSTDWLNRRRGVLAASGNVTLRMASDGVPFPNAARTPRLRGEGLAPRLRGEGLAPSLLGAVSRPLVMAMLVGAMALTAQAEDLVIDVAEGQTETRSEVISGEVRLVKTGLGTLVLSAANTYTGGTALQAGIIEVQDKDALGTGEVSINGSTTQTNQLCFKIGGSAEADYTVPNAFTIETASSLEYPVFHFADKTWFSGTIHAKANLYLSTAWNKSKLSVGTRYVKFLNTITADAGACIGGAPHCVITFNGQLITPLLDCCYAPDGMASNGGNEGRFLLNNEDNRIDRIRIEQTTVYCFTSFTCTNTVLEWTDQHLGDDVGVFDMNKSQKVFDIITPVIEKGGVGCVITNSTSSTLTLYVYNESADRDCYARLDGKLDFSHIKGIGPSRVFTFRNRRHSMSGELFCSRGTLVVGEDSAFPRVTSIKHNSSSRIKLESHESDVLEDVNSLNFGSSLMYFNTSEAIAAVSRNMLHLRFYRMYINPNSGDEFLPLEVNSAFNTEKDYQLCAGEYTSSGAGETQFACTGIKSGTLLVWNDSETGTRTGWTNMVWTGASTASHNVNDLANYEELPQYATFKVPIAWMKFGAVTGYAELTNDVNWGGITFGADSTGFTLKSAANDPTIHLYDNGLNFEAKSGETARTFTIEPTLDLQCAVPSVPEGDTLVLSGGVVGNEFVVGDSNAGTITLDGTIPASLTVPAGKLIIAANATLPAKFTMISLGSTAQLDVQCDAGEMAVDTFKIGGAVAIDGDYQYGNLIIKQRTGNVPSAPTNTAIWDGGAGEDTAITTAANWEGDVAPKFDAGVKLVMASTGTAATVSGEVMAHSLVITNLSEVGGPATFTIRGETENPAENLLTIYGHGEVRNATPLILENLTLAAPNHESQGDPSSKGAKTISLFANNATTYALKLKNAVIEKPIYGEIFSGARGVIEAASGVNEIRGVYGFDSNWMHLKVDSGATLIFSGGVKSEYKSALRGAGTMIITNRPWCGSESKKMQSYLARVVFAVAGNSLGTSISDANGLQLASGDVNRPVAEFLVDDAIDCRSTYYFTVKGNKGAALELHGTRQKTANLCWYGSANTRTDNYGYINGEAGAQLWVSNTWTTGTTAGSNFFLIKGETSFRKSGIGNFYLTRTAALRNAGTRVDHTSTGTLRVDGGSLILMDGVSWCNGPVEVASSGDTVGTLKFTENGQIGRNQPFTITGNGIIDIPSGVTVLVNAASVGGTALESGEYTKDSSGVTSGHITGEGKLKVGAPGTYFIIK